MPEQRPDPGEVAAYADGRWPVVVRTLVLLGAPPRHAVALATEAVGRLFHRSADDQWLDLDAVLAAEVVDVWEADRTAWWRRADLQVDEDLDGTGVPEALVLLDVLPPAERARLVVGAVAGLTSDQLDDVLGPAVSSPLVGAWRDDLARVAVAIPVGDAHLDEARGLSDGRRRQGRGLAVAGLVAGLVAATVAVTVAVG
ncbi:hypothetical protein, partial [Nocardioides sp.]|uniref:hypothetical protein n=1 Tax=Nocardioides sp. TaxID=35761 RepID=UPI00271C09EC